MLKTFESKLKWKDNLLKFIECTKSNIWKEINTIECIYYKRRKNYNQNLSVHLGELEKVKQIKSRVSRRKEIKSKPALRKLKMGKQ